MDFKIILAPRAIRDLEEIVRYISIDNPVRAESFGRELVKKSKMLKGFPDIGRVVPEFGEPNIRELIHLSYRIVYRVHRDKQLIEVSRFWHGARGIPRL
jgi:plasmid stabilization system protein ParE